MPHQRLRHQETVPENVKRIILEQLDRAIARLSSKTGSKDGAIHDGRVCFKKVRAMLRLVRFEIGEKTFKEENTFYRDSSRELAGLRDTAVVANTLKKLVENFADHYAATDLKWLRKRLMSSRVDIRVERKEVLQKLVQTVELARERVDSFPLSVDSFAAIGPGLQRVYRKGRKCFEAVCREPDAENLHEWRKQVKHLNYQIGVLNPIWPNMLEAHAFELDRLSGYLSEDHDLVLLKTSVFEEAKSTSQIEDGESLLAVIANRREQLQKKAMGLGARLYAETPEGFVGRLETYWNEWRPESVAGVDEEVRSETIPETEMLEAEVEASPIAASAGKASAAVEPGS